MSFNIPSLTELATRAAGAFRVNLKGSDAKLWPNNVAVSAKVIAGAVWESFSFLDFIARQIHKSTADGVHLERHADDYGLARLAASYATGSVNLRGDVGVVIPAGLLVARVDGVEYETLTGGVTTVAVSPPEGASEGVLQVAVRASVVGKTGNAFPETIIALASPLDRMDESHDVAATGIGGGAEMESDESLRARLLFRLRNPPHGGAASDYVIWAREVPGVTRVYVDPVTSENERVSVGVYILMDDTYPNGIPQSSDIAAVAAHIRPLRPAGAVVDFAAPGAHVVNITIDDLAPDTVAVRSAVEVALRDLFRRRMHVATLTDPFTLRVSKIWETISQATGEESHDLVAPADDIAIAPGQIPVLGTVSFT